MSKKIEWQAREVGFGELETQLNIMELNPNTFRLLVDPVTGRVKILYFVEKAE